MLTIYVSASSREKALGIMAFLLNDKKLKRNIKFDTPWIAYPNLPQTQEATEARVKENLAAVDRCDAMILAADYDNVPGGKFFEAGRMHTHGRPIMVLGKPENMYIRAVLHSESFNLEVLAGKLKDMVRDSIGKPEKAGSKNRAG